MPDKDEVPSPGPPWPTTTPPSWSGPRDGEELPVAVDALQRLHPRSSRVTSAPTTRSRTVLETRISPGPAARHHPGRDVHRDAADVAVTQLDLAGVQPRPELDADAGQLVPERGCAVDRPSGTVEGGQDPVAGGLDQPAAELLDQPAGPARRGRSAARASAGRPAPPARSVEPTMSVNSTVASTRVGSATRRDAGQELLDLVQGELRRLPEQRLLDPGKLDQRGSGDVLGQVASVWRWG